MRRAVELWGAPGLWAHSATCWAAALSHARPVSQP
jgi:hypothetical protein